MMMHNRSNVVSLKQLRQMFSKYLLEKETEGTLGCIVHAIKKKNHIVMMCRRQHLI